MPLYKKYRFSRAFSFEPWMEIHGLEGDVYVPSLILYATSHPQPVIAINGSNQTDCYQRLKTIARLVGVVENIFFVLKVNPDAVR